MAGENREQNIDQKAREDDALFMQIIRDFPTIYNRASKDFKDTNKKANCWRTIAQRLGEPVDSVKRRYETIRTDFSRYLRKKKGKSGSGAGNIEMDAKYEHLLWLKTIIISRPTSGNFRKLLATVPASQSSARPKQVASDSSEGSDEEVECPGSEP